jgi:AcrR family transcriptional regulator
MGIEDRRERERQKRRQEILLAAWEVAEEFGWASFSVEQVAARAELGRATIYGYFESLDALIVALAEEALESFSKQLSQAPGLTELLDVPVRFVQANRAAYELLFPIAVQTSATPTPAELVKLRANAQQLLRRVKRLHSETSAGAKGGQPDEAFLAAIAMAATVVPELRASTTLRHRWQQFCLASTLAEDAGRQESSERDPL